MYAQGLGDLTGLTREILLIPQDLDLCPFEAGIPAADHEIAVLRHGGSRTSRGLHPVAAESLHQIGFIHRQFLLWAREMRCVSGPEVNWLESPWAEQLAGGALQSRCSSPAGHRAEVGFDDENVPHRIGVSRLPASQEAGEPIALPPRGRRCHRNPRRDTESRSRLEHLGRV